MSDNLMSKDHTDDPDDEPDLWTRLNSETGRIGWPELERHFARGVVVRVAGELDLVEAACRFAEDDREAVAAWMERGQVARASEADAARWNAERPGFWAVVVAPWVMVQEVTAEG